MLPYSYTAADHAEAEAAKIAALTEEARAKRPGDIRLGDIITFVLCVLLLIGACYLVAQAPHEPHAISRQNIDLFHTLAIGSMLPLACVAVVALQLAKNSEAVRGTPFYSVKPPPSWPPPWIPRLLVGVSSTLFLVAFIVLKRPVNANWRPDFHGLLAVLNGPWIVCMFALYYAFLGGRGRQQRREPQDASETKGTGLSETAFLEFGPDGLVFSTSLVSSHVDWPYYVSYLESVNLFLLYARGTFHMIPKRAFSDAGEVEKFLGLVQEKIPAGRLLPKPVSA